MASFYVYAPFTGTGQGRYCYPGTSCGGTNCCSLDTCCAGCPTHTAGGGMTSPADIFGSSGSQVRLWVSSNILSVRTYFATFCGCEAPSGLSQGVKVDLYCSVNAPGIAFIGTVLYGHLPTRNVGNPQVYNNPNGLLIGSISTANCNCANCGGGACGSCVPGACGGQCCCNCYPNNSQQHCHMGRSSTNGFSNSWTCGTAVSSGTWIYRFDMGVGNCV
jgi:hypothetical protein